MTGRPSSYIAQEWSVHAQLTISHHHRPEVEVTPPEDGGAGDVHMEYSWNTLPPSSPTPSNPARPCYGFQRGNIVFTTRPSTGQFSPPVYGGSLPTRRPSQAYNRRCKSTCSITLSTDHDPPGPAATVTRSHSLRSEGDNPKPVSPVQEVCEVCGGDRSPSSLRRAANYTTHFCTRVPDKTPLPGPDATAKQQDAASQTTHSEEVATSSTSVVPPVQPRMGNRAYATTKRKSVADLLQIPSFDLPEEFVEETQTEKPTPKRLSRSPARLTGKSPMIVAGASRKSSSHSPDSTTTAKSQGHKPRTVHIDVYCTGSDASDTSSSSSSTSSLDSDVGEASWSSPQTVFESDKVRVVHTRAGKDRLPAALMVDPRVKRHSMKGTASSTKDETSTRGYDSDDGLSSHYPSQFSSRDSFNPSSRDPSSSTISSSSCALSDGYDSAAATSWKDTVTDLDSILQSKDSILQSGMSLAQSDSFEYADSIDRLRIKQRELAWAEGTESKTWRSPQSERRHMILEKRLTQGSFPLWRAGRSDESEEEDGDETGDAWSFGGGSSSRVSTLKREDTVRRATPNTLTTQPPPRLGAVSPAPLLLPKVESSVTSPFTPRAGLRTDQLSRAERFGTIVGAFRKPGHHVGPSKNPDCDCAHCRNFYGEQNEYRGRTRSLDMSLEAADNWKTMLQQQIADKKSRLGNVQELKPCEDQWDDSTAV